MLTCTVQAMKKAAPGVVKIVWGSCLPKTQDWRGVFTWKTEGGSSELAKGTFFIPRPGGYWVELSFFPGTGLYDVPSSLVGAKAKTLLSKETLEKLSDLETNIGETKRVLLYLPTTTFEQKLQRVELEAQLGTLEGLKRGYLKEPREQVAKELAQKAHGEYCNWLDSQLAGLKKSLPQSKHLDIGAFFEKQLGDPRYLGYSFHNLIPSDERGEAEMSVKGGLQQIYEDRVPPELRKYVTYRSRSYLFALPHAKYTLDRDIPCLDLGFDLYLVVELELREVGEAKDEFYGYQLTMRFTKDTLGRLYTVFRPDPDFSFWQTIPLTLLQGLLGGELIPDGAKVLSSGGNIAQYEIEEFEVTIPDDFANYLIEVSKKGGLAALGIVEPKTAAIIENLPPHQPTNAGASEVKVAIEKLVELGQTEPDAKKAVEAASFSKNATAEEIVTIILEKSS